MRGCQRSERIEERQLRAAAGRERGSTKEPQKIPSGPRRKHAEFVTKEQHLWQRLIKSGTFNVYSSPIDLINKTLIYIRDWKPKSNGGMLQLFVTQQMLSTAYQAIVVTCRDSNSILCSCKAMLLRPSLQLLRQNHSDVKVIGWIVEDLGQIRISCVQVTESLSLHCWMVVYQPLEFWTGAERTPGPCDAPSVLKITLSVLHFTG